jgi:hypothetical protein
MGASWVSTVAAGFKDSYTKDCVMIQEITHTIQLITIKKEDGYFTVTDLAKFRGMSGLKPFSSAV